ncbi:MAG: hypothetical protein ACREBR_02330, partial [bacterium]
CYPFTHHIPTIIARSPGSTTSIAHMIVHPNSAAPVPHSTDGPFQYTYGVPFAGHDHSTHIRAARLIEILHTYSTPPATINIVKTSEPTTQDTVQQVLCTSSPFKFAASLVEERMKDFILPTYYEPMDIINSYATCVTARPDDEWQTAYKADPDTNLFWKNLANHNPSGVTARY